MSITSCECHTHSAGTDQPSWAPCALGTVSAWPCPLSMVTLQPWLTSRHENPTENPALGFWALWGERQLAIVISRDPTQGWEVWEGAWMWPAHSGQCCCEQCGHKPGSSTGSGAGPIPPGIQRQQGWTHSGCQIWSLHHRKMKGFSSRASFFLQHI